MVEVRLVPRSAYLKSLLPLSHKPLTKGVGGEIKQDGTDEGGQGSFLNCKVVDQVPVSDLPQLLGPGKVTLPHRPQFLQPANELLGSLWLHHTEFYDQVLTGDASAFCGGDNKMSLERSAAEKGHCVGEKAEGGSSIMLGPGGAAQKKYSPAQLLAQPLCWNKKTQPEVMVLPLGTTPFSAIPAGPAVG